MVFNIGKLNRTSSDCKFGQTVSHLSVTAFMSSICTLESMRSSCVCLRVDEGREGMHVEMVFGKISAFSLKQVLSFFLRKHLEGGEACISLTK